MKKHCPITGVNIPRFLMMVVAGFVVLYAYEYLLHGVLLMEDYQNTVNLWRPHEAMIEYMPWSIASQLGFVVVLGFIFTRNFEERGWNEGLRFGLMMGLLVGVMQFGMYAYMPIPLGLALSWMAGAIVEMSLVGIVFRLVYRK